MTRLDDRSRQADGAPGDDQVPRRVRRFVTVLLVALMVPGLVGFDLWPLTAWRMFSLTRKDTQQAWVVETVAVDGGTRILDLEELPLPYRHAEWRLRVVYRGSDRAREELCVTLGDAAAEVAPDVVEARLARDRQTLVKTDDGHEVRHDPEVFHTCEVGAGA